MRYYIIIPIIPCLVLCGASARAALTTTAAAFTPNCIGEKLNPGEELVQNEVIGPSWNCDDGGYRLGLDAEGWLAYWTHDDAVGWWPGVQGDTLRMEQDGNLVLYENDEVIWESGCYGDGVALQNTGGIYLGEAVDAQGEVVWRIYDNGQESKCHPGQWSSEPQVKCRGNILGSKVRLLRNEYICGLGGHHRFGLNTQGKLGLWHGNRLVWSASQLADDWGDFLLLQKSGKLVHYEDRDGTNIPKWKTNCINEGAILEIMDGGVTLEQRDGEVLWMIDALGIESIECNPSPRNPVVDCSHISSYGNTCSVQMIDRMNVNIVNIQVNDLGDNKFEIIDNVDSECGGAPWNVSIKVQNNGNGKVSIDAGVPKVTCETMLADYPMKDDVQLTWLRDDTLTCNKFGESLIYFMVMEWFYFG